MGETYPFFGPTGSPYVNQSRGPQVCYNIQRDRQQRRLKCEYDEYLAIKAEEHCQLLHSPVISVIISLTAFAKVVTMSLAARVSRDRSPPLLTVGDAVASFLTRPDPTTKGMCWVSSEDHEGITYKRLSSRKFYGKASSTKRRPTTLLLDLDVLVLPITLPRYRSTRKSLEPRELTTKRIRGDGLLWHASMYCVIQRIPDPHHHNLLLVQWRHDQHASSSRALFLGGYTQTPRVTWPVKGSMQRSTYWLSVPYQYGIPALILYMILHWLVSLSVLYIQIIHYDMLEQLTNLTDTGTTR
ncbi:hypothetical protein BDV26DRAFT_293783 [Aspergillus bertholletiae]|uniref:Uncharacterized protein n=1 Tax=Aspergillus bertholletiae TaxID=1226010 RepID=A0A5N7B625_9EURO|nr:hypothetical protein BDV26DRAFT_293783 [Aspergillus bertholletiae]